MCFFPMSAVIKAGLNHRPDDWMNDVVSVVSEGGIIGYPTETIYGIGGDATSDRVVQRVNGLKKRDARHPMLVLVGRKSEIHRLARGVSGKAEILMDRLWPGPLTLVFDALPVLPKGILSEEGRIGVRISSDPVCQALLKKLGKPLISTSANPHGKKPARSAAEVRGYFGTSLDLIIDGGERKGRVPSTVLDVSTDPPRLIREGAVKTADIIKWIGEIHENESV
jgi:L-threonylcarbamoyladenylate synthase